MHLSKAQVIAFLKEQGFAFSELELVTEGKYSILDVDWNYRDIMHMDHMHGGVHYRVFALEETVMGSLWFQKFFGLKLPASLVSYKRGKNFHHALTVWGPFLLFSEVEFRETRPEWTQAVTHYLVGAPRWLFWAVPFVKWALKRNYNELLAEDIPMRERRGQLRAWGYSFATDALGMTYPDSLDNQINRVIPPPVLPNWEETIPLSQLREQGECLMGSSDSRGLRLRYTEGKIEVFPRSCPHEGAPLDQAKCHEGQLQCPWHGRKLSSLASFFSTQPQLIQLPFHTIRFDSRQLVVSSHPLVHRAESSCELQP